VSDTWFLHYEDMGHETGLSIATVRRWDFKQSDGILHISLDAPAGTVELRGALALNVRDQLLRYVPPT
jgi:hypothetical protein